MQLSLVLASPEDVMTIVSIRNEAAQHLTAHFGNGHWSYLSNEKWVLEGMKGNSRILAAKNGNMIVGTLRLATKKPWAIDIAYFTKVQQPVYLTDMAVHPDWQGKGIGKFMLENVKPFVAAWPAQAIRLDAYDHAAGAGEFYFKCGFTEKGRIVYRNTPLIYFELLV